MRAIRYLGVPGRRGLGAGFAAVALTWLGVAGAAGDEPAQGASDALVRQPSKNVDEFFLRPGAQFSVYRKVLLGPVEVAFAKHWEREHREVDARESLRLRTELAKLVREEFTLELQRKDGYPLVASPGPDVLEVRASIVDLRINAPEDESPGKQTYVLSAGEGTLLAELRDSQTGALLARVVDQREARWHGNLQIANRVTNSFEARVVASTWSRLLRRFLDRARAAPAGAP